SPDGRSLFFWRPDGANDMPMVLDMTTPGATPVALTDTSLFLGPNVSTSVSWGPHETVAVTIPPAGLSSLPSVAALRTGEPATVPLATLPGAWTDSPAFLPEAGGTRGPTLLYRARAGNRTTLETIGSVGDQTAPTSVLSRA